MSFRSLSIAFMLLVAGAPAFAAIKGVVVAPDGAAIQGATVTAEETGKTVTTDANGHFKFAALDPGTHAIVVTKSGYLDFHRPILFAHSNPVSIRLTALPEQSKAMSLEKIVVSASPLVKTAADFAVPTVVLTGPKLLEIQAPTIGETLAGMPGISASQYGAGASRPIIRGLGGARIRVLENGLDTLDASDISPDHAIAIEPLIAQQIEVLEGPQTVLYGSGAFGGVVNVVDNRVPRYVPDDGFDAALEMRGDTASTGRAGVATIDGGVGHFAFHFDLSRRKTSDYDIPSEAANQLGLADNTLPNSAVNSTAGSVGMSYVGKRGYIGLAIERYLNQYEIPVGAVTPAMRAAGLPWIDQQQTRYMLLSKLDALFAGFESATFGATHSDYRHFEMDGNTIGSTFIVNGDQARFALRHKPIGGFKGAFGAEYTTREFYVLGEALVPRNRTHNAGLFAVEERTFGKVELNGGLRFEHQSIDVDSSTLPGQDTNAVTAAIGTIWHFTPGYDFVVHAARSQRIPAAEELYYGGPHDATASFEIGNPTLGKETSRSLNLSLRKTDGALTGMVNLFVNDILDFIYQRTTGQMKEGLPVRKFTAAHARFYGGEGRLDYAFERTSAGQFKLGVFADYVRARLVDVNQNVPHIPPLSYGLRFDYTRGALDTGIELRRVGSQDDIAPFETPTAGYTNLNLNVSYTIINARSKYTFFLRSTNLLDQVERNSTSYLKDIAPLPGRSLTFGLRISFD